MTSAPSWRAVSRLRSGSGRREPEVTFGDIRPIDPSNLIVARRIVEIQRAAYSVEAEIIGFDGIPQLTESVDDVVTLTAMRWNGAFDDDRLVGVIGWTEAHGAIDIDRLAVDPSSARRGFGRMLVRSVPAGRRITVSTGAKNTPACSLYVSEGFERVGDAEIAPEISIRHFERRLK